MRQDRNYPTLQLPCPHEPPCEHPLNDHKERWVTSPEGQLGTILTCAKCDDCYTDPQSQ